MTPLADTVTIIMHSQGHYALLVFLVLAALMLPLAVARDRLLGERRQMASRGPTKGDLIEQLSQTTQTRYGLKGHVAGDTFYTQCPLSSLDIAINLRTHQDQFGRCYHNKPPAPNAPSPTGGA